MHVNLFRALGFALILVGSQVSSYGSASLVLPPYHKIMICTSKSDLIVPKLIRFLNNKFGGKYSVFDANEFHLTNEEGPYSLVYFGNIPILERPPCLEKNSELARFIERTSEERETSGSTLPPSLGEIIGHRVCGIEMEPSSDGHALFVASLQFTAESCNMSNILTIFQIDPKYCETNQCDID